MHARERRDRAWRVLDQGPGAGGGRGRSRVFYGLSEELCEAVRRTVAGGEPEIEPEAEHVWQWFWDAHRGRQAGMSGWLPLSAAELLAWAQISGAIVNPEEWQLIRDMDLAFLQASAKRGDGEGGRQSDEELTPALFDAMFG
ncbi:phage tail assembly chaperone [Mesorhizobium sp. PUT5]|uniref:phage tail assembly chaperone n=1 Tax=Mesorhizobium sp. PUT5 TaxID=3454629 RepID=UPI003FA49E22